MNPCSTSSQQFLISHMFLSPYSVTQISAVFIELFFEDWWKNLIYIITRCDLFCEINDGVEKIPIHKQQLQDCETGN